jgi:hypothetical protein
MIKGSLLDIEAPQISLRKYSKIDGILTADNRKWQEVRRVWVKSAALMESEYGNIFVWSVTS